MKSIHIQSVQQYFPIQSFRPFQMEIMTQILNKKDVLAILPTGSGKSLCYQYPATQFDGLTIVVSPLIALMQDQIHHLKQLNIPAACLNSSISKKEYEKTIQGISKGEYKILYVSPERLKFPKFIRFIQNKQIDFLVVDEAHCISMWGFDFRPDFLFIKQFIQKLPYRPVIAAFSATATDYSQNEIKTMLQMKNCKVFHAGFRRDNLDISVIHCSNSNSKYRSLYAFLKKHEKESGIIYCSSVLHVLNVYEHLKTKAKTLCYYADLDERQKEKNYKQFMKENCVMVATNAFGMGIDKANIRFILHFDIPKTMEEYYQEIGRAGRDGLSAKCILFDEKSDRTIIEKLIQQNQFSMFQEEMNSLAKQRFQAMIDYVTTTNPSYIDKIEKYFKEWKPNSNLLTKELTLKVEEYINTIPVLYFNATKVATTIRNGNYVINAVNTLDLGNNKITFTLDQHLSYFDMMVSDAIYTLWFYQETITPTKILRILSGNPSAMFNRHKKDERLHQIQESIKKLESTMITIENRETRFLYTKDWTMPLYRYAEIKNELRTLKREYLFIQKKNGVPQDNSIENLKLRHFLGRRILLAHQQTNRTISTKIRFEQDRTDRVGMWNILDISFAGQETKYLKNRKWKMCWDKVTTILDYYKSIAFLSDYQWIYGKSILGPNYIVGVNIQY